MPDGGRPDRLGFDAAERARIRAGLAADEAIACPRCGAPLRWTAIEARPDLAYARRRVWVYCAGCDRATALDAPGR